MKKQFVALFIFGIFSLSFPTLHASRSNPFTSEEEADNYLTTHYNRGCEHYNRQKWRRASSEFEKVIYFFPNSEDAAKASYFLAICYFEMKEYDFANEEFSNYLKASHHPAFFEDAVYYKFCIAEYFKSGKKRRPFKMRYLPKWISAQDSALTIYDEVVAAFPNHELTIRALNSKADLLKSMGEYRDCVETYQTIIRRFPKDEIVPACYLNIAETYDLQSRYEFQNPDILAFAELNVRKFKDDFPRDDRVIIAEESVCRIKEMYAKGLCDLGLFYERMEQPDAAAIYYQSSIEEFPDTRVAEFCRSRLICLGYAKEEAPVSCEEEPNACIDEIVSPISDLSNQEEVYSPQEQSPIPIQEQSIINENFSSTEENSTQEYVEGRIDSQIEDFPPQVDEMIKEQDQVREQDQANDLSQNQNHQEEVKPVQEENTHYFLHYSQLKHREQHVTPQE